MEMTENTRKWTKRFVYPLLATIALGVGIGLFIIFIGAISSYVSWDIESGYTMTVRMLGEVYNWEMARFAVLMYLALFFVRYYNIEER